MSNALRVILAARHTHSIHEQVEKSPFHIPWNGSIQVRHIMDCNKLKTHRPYGETMGKSPTLQARLRLPAAASSLPTPIYGRLCCFGGICFFFHKVGGVARIMWFLAAYPHNIIPKGCSGRKMPLAISGCWLLIYSDPPKMLKMVEVQFFRICRPQSPNFGELKKNQQLWLGSFSYFFFSESQVVPDFAPSTASLVQPSGTSLPWCLRIILCNHHRTGFPKTMKWWHALLNVYETQRRHIDLWIPVTYDFCLRNKPFGHISVPVVLISISFSQSMYACVCTSSVHVKPCHIYKWGWSNFQVQSIPDCLHIQYMHIHQAFPHRL